MNTMSIAAAKLEQRFILMILNLNYLSQCTVIIYHHTIITYVKPETSILAGVDMFINVIKTVK